MHRTKMCTWMALAAGSAAVAAGGQVWKDKLIAEWTAEEARQVLTESPWAKSVTPVPAPVASGSGGAGQQRVGMSAGGVGIGGMGTGRRGGRGGGGGRGSSGAASADAGQMPVLTLRWASAMPAIAAGLIARETNAPSVDEGHYGIAVYGMPASMIRGDPNKLGPDLKQRAAIRREGKKDMKPSTVQVLLHDEGPVILYLFPRSNEITRKDKQLEFDAEIGGLKLTQSFVPDKMVYQGKLEL